MSVFPLLHAAIYMVVLLALAKPLGAYMARVYQSQPCGLDRALGWLERLIYRLSGIDPTREMGWKTYAAAVLFFNLFGVLVVYVLQRTQYYLPLNPEQLPESAPILLSTRR